MRILFWQEGFWPNGGGTTVMGQHLLCSLRDRGHDIAVVTRRDSSELPERHDWRGIPVHRFPFWRVIHEGKPAEVGALCQRISTLARSFAPDVVHLNGFGPSALFRILTARATPAPTVVALHSANTLSALPTSLARQLLESADWVVACAAALLTEARRNVPAIASFSSVLHNGVTTPVRPAVPPPPAPRLLCIGWLVPHKGFDLAIRALAALQGRFPGLTLRIAGKGSERSDLERLALRAGVSDRVEFLGAVPHEDVPRLLDEASALVIPSRREAFPLVALEAGAAARPVVAARVGGLEELVADGETGFLVAPESAESLAGAISILLSDPPRAAAMGAAARALVLRRFSLDAHVDAYEKLYDRLRARSAVGRSAACG